MPIQLSQSTTDRGQFVEPAAVGQIMRMMLVDEVTRDRTKMGSDEPVLNASGNPSKKILLTGVTLAGSTMPDPRIGVAPLVNELQRMALQSVGFGALIEATRQVGGRQVGDIVEVTAICGVVWRATAGGKFEGVTTIDPTEIAAAKAANKLGWNYTVTIRRATPTEAGMVANAEAEWNRLNAKEPISLSGPASTPTHDDDPF